MSNSAFHKLVTGFETTYKYNEYFREYVDANFKGRINMYRSISFTTEDMKAARTYWKKNQKKHPNYPWFDIPDDAYKWIDNMPFGGYEY